MFFFLLCLLLIQSLSLEESDFLNDESNKLGYDSSSYGTYSFRAFPLRVEESVAGVLGSKILAPIGVEYVSDVFTSYVL